MNAAKFVTQVIPRNVLLFLGLVKVKHKSGKNVNTSIPSAKYFQKIVESSQFTITIKMTQIRLKLLITNEAMSRDDIFSAHISVKSVLKISNKKVCYVMDEKFVTFYSPQKYCKMPSSLLYGNVSRTFLHL